MSDRNNNKTKDMSDRDIIMLDNICPTKIVIQRKAPSYLRLFCVCVSEFGILVDPSYFTSKGPHQIGLMNQWSGP